MESTFSQRIGKNPLIKEIQVNHIDVELANGLWNIIKLGYLDNLDRHKSYNEGDFNFWNFVQRTWHIFYKLPIDEIPKNHEEIEYYIRKRFFESEWFEIYDFIEFILSFKYKRVSLNPLADGINKLLEREFSGYRIVNLKVIPITNEIETDDISRAIVATGNLSPLEGANIHLDNSLKLISDKKNPDFRNSIKESISAVESTCRIITGEKTLGKALNKLKNKGLDINDQLKTGFDKIYAYTNSTDNGIRHAIIKEHKDPDFDDAKYMLVSCSAFINYLIGKANSIGIKIQ